MAVPCPSLAQLSAGHTSIYEAYFRQVDVKGTGKVSAVDAAKFLKKSNLKESVLHKIWEICNPQGKAFLDKQAFFLAFRLIANAQNGKEVSLGGIHMPGQAPNLGELPTPVVPPPQDSVWAIKQVEKTKYDSIFEGLHPVNGMLPGDKVKPVLLNSKLPVDVLGRVWDLADIDADGMLDKDEFAVAMHLVYKALEGVQPVPQVLPPRLIPPSKRNLRRVSPLSASPVMGVAPLAHSTSFPLPPVSTPPASTVAVSTAFQFPRQDTAWVVTPNEKLKYDGMFLQADSDKDGLVSGEEIRNLFIDSGLPQQILAHIWSLCDFNNTGQLNSEQFALAMHFVQQKLHKGIDPPQQLKLEMIPPSMRKGQDSSSSSPGTMPAYTNDFSAIKELDKITNEIEELGREKAALQKEIEEKEELIRQRTGEIENLQTDLEKSQVRLKELEIHKKEAQSQLDKLDEEKAKYEKLLQEVQGKCQEETQKINTLKTQLSNQEASVKAQEDELGKARNELNKLRQEETNLEQQVESSREHLETIQKQCKSVQVEMSQVRAKLATLTETNNMLNNQITHYNNVLQNSGTIANATNSSLAITDLAPLSDHFDMTPTPSETDAMSMRATAGSSPVSSLSGFSVGSGRVDEVADDDFKDKDTGDEFKDNDPFKSKDNIFSNSEGESSDPFQSDDPFKSDSYHPFKSVSFADPFAAGDPFEDKDPFGNSDDKSQDGDPFKTDPFKSDLPEVSSNDSASTVSNGLTPQGSDPFASLDPFGSAAFPSTKACNDDFFSSDPFSPTTPHQTTPTPTNDNEFGSDPFKALGSLDSQPANSNTNTEDPFASTDDPFSSSDLFGDSSAFTSSANDPFSSNTESKTIDDPFTSTDGKTDDPFRAFGSFDNMTSSTAISEKDQLEWAKLESEKLEKERRAKEEALEKQEQMELAIALKKSVESSSDA